MSGGPTAEKRTPQKLIMLFVSVCFVALLVMPALDHRMGWSRVPTGVVLLGNLLVATGFYLIFLVYRENTYTSATIEVAEGQKVVYRTAMLAAVVEKVSFGAAVVVLFLQGRVASTMLLF